jgi:hypothetical protein
MAFKREMLAEIARLQALAAENLAAFDALHPPASSTKGGVVLEGRVEGDEIVVDAPPPAPRRSPR